MYSHKINILVGRLSRDARTPRPGPGVRALSQPLPAPHPPALLRLDRPGDGLAVTQQKQAIE